MTESQLETLFQAGGLLLSLLWVDPFWVFLGVYISLFSEIIHFEGA